jgi:hypothetical protein
MNNKRKMEKKRINETKSWFSEKMNKINKMEELKDPNFKNQR